MTTFLGKKMKMFNAKGHQVLASFMTYWLQ